MKTTEQMSAEIDSLRAQLAELEATQQPAVAVGVSDAAGYYEQFTEFARKLGYLGIAHALDDVMRLRSASELEAERWSRAADKAAEDARAVFKDACNHTQDAIEYMKAHMLAATASDGGAAQPISDSYYTT